LKEIDKKHERRKTKNSLRKPSVRKVSYYKPTVIIAKLIELRLS